MLNMFPRLHFFYQTKNNNNTNNQKAFLKCGPGGGGGGGVSNVVKTGKWKSDYLNCFRIVCGTGRVGGRRDTRTFCESKILAYNWKNLLGSGYKNFLKTFCYFSADVHQRVQTKTDWLKPSRLKLRNIYYSSTWWLYIPVNCSVREGFTHSTHMCKCKVGQ